MTKIVFNGCHGGFSVSNAAMLRYAEIKGITLYTRKNKFGMTDFYLCPPEEYDRISAEEQAMPVSPGRFARSNALYFSDRDFERNDPVLVQVVEELGDKANGSFAELRIIDIPAGTRYRFEEYDGWESVMTEVDYEWEVA
jgi:hypothetical protein